MMLAQALIYYHLGCDWTWKRDVDNDETYERILRTFLDTWDAEYSIHNIAQMGVGEGKRVGEWFGPNTASQVLRKLVLFDESSEVCVHVAMDNTVVIDDIKTLCKSKRELWEGFSPVKTEDDEPVILEDEPIDQSQEEPMPVNTCTDEVNTECGTNNDESMEENVGRVSIESFSGTEAVETCGTDDSMVTCTDDSMVTSCPPENSTDVPETSNELQSSSTPTDMNVSQGGNSSDCLCEGAPDLNDSTSSAQDPTATVSSQSIWQPLILFIPLRLGLMEINSDYYSSLKAMFTLKQSLGVIGGKPNHAHYFIGFNGDRLLYLDPHTTQENVRDNDETTSFPDDTYHCTNPSFMDFASLDPSLALGFYCETEEIFDEWASAIKELVMDREQRPMFEICEKRPAHWPPFELPRKPCAMRQDSANATSEVVDDTTYDYGEEDQIFDSSGEYEII